ncbi:MAG TPA: enhanced serine sensitivity protein SseB C-terminal domain-containing protein [Desulfosporosinus sp.]|nr:enhanced serine sensitivity protein SseB C-terminal domain-containing protein [Desulfosporosinus sp.]
MDENIRLFCANFHPEESLKLAQQEPTPENERRFFSELKNARFLVPCVLKSGQPADKAYPAVLSTQEGEKFLPAFSELAEFEKWPFSRTNVSVFSFDDLKHIILEDQQKQNLAGIAINPFGQTLPLRHSQIAHVDTVMQGMSAQRVNHDAGLRLLRPKGLPSGLKEGLKALFRQRREVYGVYLLLAQGAKESNPHWLFLIDFDGTEASLFPKVAEAVQSYLKQGNTFELMKATPRLLQNAVAEGEPIYQC